MFFLSNSRTYIVNHKSETCILIGVATLKQPEQLLMEYFDELAFLATTAGAITQNTFYQKLDHPLVGTYLGIGKIQEINIYIQTYNIDMVICDDDLTPIQMRHLEAAFKVKILDRSALILDIFAMRARTAQARTQVELAQYQYLLPRLRGMWKHLERQQGGIGSRGPGEKEIETDKRIVNDKIAHLKKRLSDIDKQNVTQRKTRAELVRVALVGYTNVGKSTIMAILSKEEVFVENKLFATLDTLVRKITIERTPFLLSDTVGFIRKLPHHLIESFKSTLDEVREADVLLHVVDIAHPAFEHHMEVVQKTLLDLKVTDRQVLTVFNKMDAYRRQNFDDLLPQQEKAYIETELCNMWSHKLKGNVVFISAIDKENIEMLREMVLQLVRQQYAVKYPYLVEFF